MDKIKVSKAVSNFVVSVSVSTVVGLGLKTLISSDESMKCITKLMVLIGSGVIGTIAANEACKYTENQIDEIVEVYKDVSELVE